jgi:ABC-type amino acid transport substrate-binding protein
MIARSGLLRITGAPYDGAIPNRKTTVKRPLPPLIAALVFSGAAFARDNDTLRLGIDPGYPPMDEKAPDGSFKGFDVDPGNEICKRIHARCQWVELEFSEMIPALQARKIDGIISSMAITEKREQQILFSSKLFQFKSRLIARQGSALANAPAALAGKQIGVQSGSQFETWSNTHWAPNGVHVVAYKGQDEVCQDPVNGRLDGALLGSVEANLGSLRKREGKGFAFVGEPLSMGDRGVGMGLQG